MPRDVMSFLEQYRDAFDHLDGNAIAALYCVPSAIADHRGPIGSVPVTVATTVFRRTFGQAVT